MSDQPGTTKEPIDWSVKPKANWPGILASRHNGIKKTTVSSALELLGEESTPAKLELFARGLRIDGFTLQGFDANKYPRDNAHLEDAQARAEALAELDAADAISVGKVLIDGGKWNTRVARVFEAAFGPENSVIQALNEAVAQPVAARS